MRSARRFTIRNTRRKGANKLRNNFEPSTIRERQLRGMRQSVKEVWTSSPDYPPAEIVNRPMPVPMLGKPMRIIVYIMRHYTIIRKPSGAASPGPLYLVDVFHN